jgi:hypothetical protein
MPLRDLLRRRRDRRDRVDLEHPLTEDDVRRIQRVQRASPKAVRVLRRGQ